MSTKSQAVDYRVRVHNVGTTDPDDSTVDFTLTLAHLASEPVFETPEVRPLEGKTESYGSAFDVVDAAGIVTSHLADPATGRAWLLGRIVQVQRAEDGGPWETVGTGRLTEISESDGPGKYRIRVQDERWVERRATAFKTGGGTTFLYPPNLIRPARVDVVQTIGDHVRVRLRSDVWLAGAARSFIQGDLVKNPLPDRNDGHGNFQHTRLHLLSGTDYEIVSFDDLSGHTFVESLSTVEPSKGDDLMFWVWAPGGVPEEDARLYAPTAEPSDALPVHAGSWVNPPGVTPFDHVDLWGLVQALYDEAGVRYDPAAFAALPPQHVKFRVKSSEKLDRWLEENAYKPYGVVPFVDAEGRVAPKSVRLPQDLDPDTLFVFDASNLAEAPVWDHASREMVTGIKFVYEQHFNLGVSIVNDSDINPFLPGVLDEGFGLDGIGVRELEREVNRQSAGQAPEGKTLTIHLRGIRTPGAVTSTYLGVPITPGAIGPNALEDAIAEITTDIFDRYLDGAQEVRFPALALEVGSAAQPGDFVILDCDALKLPNAATNARTGLRIVQIMRRVRRGAVVEFEALDAGPKLQPLATPAVTVAQSAGNPNHDLVITLSGVPAGAFGRVQFAYDAGFAEVVRTADALGNGAHTIGPFPSGTTVWVRAASTAPNRIRSPWSAADSVTTEALAAPTNVQATVDGRTIATTCTPTEPGYPLMPTLDGANVLASPLPAGSDTFVHAGLDASTQYDVGFRHVDAYGGQGPIAHVSATTGTDQVLVAPRRLRVIQGRTGLLYPLKQILLLAHVGVELRWRPVELHAETRVQVSTDETFATVDFETLVPAGVGTARIHTLLIRDPVFVRVRHEREGFAASPWSSAVSTFPTVLSTETPETDAFPGGWAFLTASASGVVRRDIGSDDADTDRAYFAVSKAGYPAVDESDSFIDRDNLPSSADAGITLAAGETAFMTVRFWSQVGGFGQSVRARVEAMPDVPVKALPPTCSVQAEQIIGNQFNVRITGANGDGTDTDLQYQWRSYLANEVPPAYGAFEALPVGGIVKQVTRGEKYTLAVQARVKDAAGRVSEEARLGIAPRLDGIDDGDGRIDPTIPYSGSTRTPNDTDLDSQSKGQNLGGHLSGAGHTVAGVVGVVYVLDQISRTGAGLAIGETVSVRGFAVADDGFNSTLRIGLRFRDSGGATISTIFGAALFTTITGQELKAEAITVPAGTFSVDVVAEKTSTPFADHSFTVSEIMLSRGPKARPFEEPPFRYQRDRNLPADVNVDGPLWVPDNAVVSIGTAADPRKAVKVIRFPHTNAQPASGSPTGIVYGPGAIFPSTSGEDGEATMGVLLPPGVTVTRVAAFLHRFAASDFAEVEFERANPILNNINLATLTAPASGWSLVVGAVNEVVGGELYVFRITINSDPSHGTVGAAFAYAEVEYEVPDYLVGL